ncbi:hypothetical protein Tco_1011132, partial [Tanacetum coccineum]
GRTGGQTSRGGGRTREPTGRVGGQTGDQDGQGGNHASNIQGDVRNVSMNESRGDSSYKEFLACNPKDYDGKGGAIAYTRWTKKMEPVQTRGREAALGMTWEDFKTLMREVLCLNNEMQKLETKLVPHLVTLENKRIERYIYGLALHIYVMVAATEPIIIQSVVLKARMLTDEAIRNASLKKNTEKRGKGGEPSRDGNVKDDNKRSRTGKAFAIITNPIR